MKIAMITDIEGVSGSNWGGFGMPQSGELPYYTRIMTAEINTVVRTLLDEGADKICVYEAHTFEPGVLPDDTRIEIGRDYRAFEDSDALFVVGQHGPAGDPKSVLAHTMNSVCNYKVTLNGMNCGELTYCAAVAGAMGIPTVSCQATNRPTWKDGKISRKLMNSFATARESATMFPFVVHTKLSSRNCAKKRKLLSDTLAKLGRSILGRLLLK